MPADSQGRTKTIYDMGAVHTLADLLALVDLGQLVVEHLVALLADVDDLGTLDTPA